MIYHSVLFFLFFILMWFTTGCMVLKNTFFVTVKRGFVVALIYERKIHSEATEIKYVNFQKHVKLACSM